MNTFAMGQPHKKRPIAILLAIIVVALAVGAYFLSPRFEMEPPRITLVPDVDALGAGPIEIGVADPGTGLRSVAVTLSQGGAEHALAAEQLDRSVHEKKLSFSLAKVKDVKEGPAVLRIAARDGSWWNFFRGNEAVLTKNITIDLTAPTLELIADDRYVNFGGVGAIVYKTSSDVASSGVQLGKRFFPGFPGQVKDHLDYFIALFAHPYDTAAELRPTLMAVDKAGNKRELGLVYELKDVRYRKSTIALSDNFLQGKVVPLLPDPALRQGSPKDIFVAVNKELRKKNEEKIAEVTSKATAVMQWQDAFAQLSNSKVEANFADQRTYTYNGEPIDTAYHLGYDLSVTKNYSVEASNNGTVAFTGPLGIYGNTVILDHGLGLFTLYSHLSSIDVKLGNVLTKRQILGKTGETGLAAGDHLHFGVYLDGVAVLPVEWWDQKWINDNIKSKLTGASSEEIAAARPAATSKAKPRGKVQAGRKSGAKKRH